VLSTDSPASRDRASAERRGRKAELRARAMSRARSRRVPSRRGALRSAGPDR
jgi:hypothetical protein